MSRQQSATSHGEQNAATRPDKWKNLSHRGVETSSAAPAGRRVPTHARRSVPGAVPAAEREDRPRARDGGEIAAGAEGVNRMSALTPAHLALIRLIARQAVRDHLTPQRKKPRGMEPERSNRAVQSRRATR
ncbi:hypothetical protein ebA531 [Aromatoleum aromaticum EbN1]|uniref:Uncharacterized protein n=1 Tax=Aromatoleum aromaticum (strain DSM 19018 / LMG 30748 / EbN1) TaxID=76114 RepID=Q5P8G5_AROAE|nr:hypothetical protein ebA531 [Aromatoleum aromaticum EbN1]